MTLYKNKIGCLIILFFVTCLNYGSVCSAAPKTASWLDEPLTIRFQDEPLHKVLEKISKQTGIAILYDQELADEKVTCDYKSVKVSEAISRLFSDKNKSIQVSKDKKVIIVKTFGAKKFVWSIEGQETITLNHATGPITFAELKKLHSVQYKNYKNRIANDNEIVEGGMTRGELRAMQEEQYKHYQARLNNDNEVLEGGLTRKELRSMQESQYENYKERIANDNEILEGGITRGDLRAMQEEQYKKYQARLSNENEVLEGGMTRNELRKLQEKQYEEYKKRQNNPERIIQ